MAAAATLPGYRAGLIELAVISRRHDRRGCAAPYAVRRRAVRRRLRRTICRTMVGLPGVAEIADVWAAGLASPPADDAAVDALAKQMARSRYIEGLLEETA